MLPRDWEAVCTTAQPRYRTSGWVGRRLCNLTDSAKQLLSTICGTDVVWSRPIPGTEKPWSEAVLRDNG
jgi:hypothetical protein